MAKTKASVKVTAFNVAKYSDDDVTIAKYMSAILGMNDSDLSLAALNNVARAKGMAQVARDTGLGSGLNVFNNTLRFFG